MGRQSVEDLLEGVELESLDRKSFDGLFPTVVDGKPNPDRVRAHAYLIENLLLKVQTGKIERLPPGMNGAQLKALMKEIAKSAYGMDEKRIFDTRTEGEILADAMSDIAQHPDRIFEVQEDVLKAMEDAFDRIELDGENRIKQYITDRTSEICLGKEGRIRRIRMMIRRVRRLRRRASQPIWNKKADPVQQAAQEATHVWRHIAYIRRSGLAYEGDHPRDTIIDLGPHHAKMSVDVWQAEKGVDFLPETDEDGNYINDTEVLPRRGAIRCHGALVICPPAHSKTEFAQGWVTTRISLNPKTQGAYLGETDDLAQKNLQYIGAAFTLEDAAGRRNATLYPKIQIDGKVSSKKFRVKVDSRKKTPTLTASGAMSGMQGVDHDFQVHDDVVPQSDADSETERERRKRQLWGTTKMRLRGDRHFTLVVCTLWHQHDANSTLMERARNGKAAYLVSKQVVGGPKTTPRFFSLWRKIPPKALERKFNTEMNGDIRMWSATHQANPRPIESRIIRSVRLYDVDSPEHAKFLKSGPMRWVSIDPSFSLRKGADKTGFLYVGVGNITSEEQDDDGRTERVAETRMRIMVAEEFQANAAVISAKLQTFAALHPVDNVAIESESGGAVTADWIERECGAPVVRLRTMGNDKEKRLRKVARFIEDQTHEWTIARACVEFPAKKDENGHLRVVNEEVKRLIDEILDFGVCPHDHMLDALTQVVWHLGHELAPGRGEWSEAVIEAADLKPLVRDERKERMLRLFGEQAVSKKTADEADWEFAETTGDDW